MSACVDDPDSLVIKESVVMGLDYCDYARVVFFKQPFQCPSLELSVQSVNVKLHAFNVSFGKSRN